MTPYPDLPHTHNNLKAFESVARLMSFTQAALELNITQSAISRQVKQLETELNHTLIIRKHRHIELTAKGEALYSALKVNYKELQSVFSSWNQSETKKVTIKAVLGFANRVLIPKLKQLNDNYPEYEFIVIPSVDENEQLAGDDFDLLVFNSRIGEQYTDKEEITFLREEYMAPVFSPILIKKMTNESLLSMPRLHASKDHHDWKEWLLKENIQDTAKSKNTSFYSLDLALNACVSGVGATIADLLLVLPELEDGTLLSPKEYQAHKSDWKYFCYAKTQTPIIKEIVNWLENETKNDIEKFESL
ncbi:LysR family transcriptional regulator [Vibrio sp. MACH09]|uniref:LysR family transcriptional regulator n=1 Tax=Vibrio sp. MACH09 TaxID=3025122 RepID=UPI00278D6578|nr:LysR family transcriptional regulator [Vibrio sp. MACH09]GLO62520.1 LysR family transcriptional regulator [Vibrio sp. MACH09]